MSHERTPTQRLATAAAKLNDPVAAYVEELLGRSLGEYVNEKRSAFPRWSWSEIATQLSDDTDAKVTISAEYLRRLYGADPASVAS